MIFLFASYFTVFLHPVYANEEGLIRLSGGTSSLEGRVEIFHDDVWGSICDDDWGMDEATVVCNQLGFPLATVADR